MSYILYSPAHDVVREAFTRPDGTFVPEKVFTTEARALYEDMKANGDYSATYEEFTTYNDRYDILTTLYSRRVLKFFRDNTTVTD